MPADVTIVSNNVAAVIAAIERAAREGNLKVAQMVAESAQAEIQSGPKTGRVYHGHQASAPGEAPAIITGDLFTGIVYGPAPEDGPTAAKAESTDEKAHDLEFGPADGRYAPRPYLGPAAKAVAPRHAEIVAAEIQKALG